MMSENQMKKKDRGKYFHLFDKNVGVHLVKCFAISVVNCLSNCTGVLPLDVVERFLRKEEKKINISPPHLLKEYNRKMGGLDLFYAAVGA